MAPNFQSSFIPKEPVSTQVFKKKKIGVVGFFVVSLFVVSIAISVGMYFYKSMIQNEINNLEQQLSEAENKIDTKTIDDLSRFSKKLEMAKSIVIKHQVITKFLEDLASSTVSAVQFTDFSYGNLEQNKLSVNAKGKATNYASIALQEQVLLQNPYLKSVIFSNLDLGDKGAVSFDVAMTIDPKIVSYSP